MKIKLNHLQLLYVGFDDYQTDANGKIWFKDPRDLRYALLIKSVLGKASTEQLFQETGMGFVKQTDNYVFKDAVKSTPSIIIVDYRDDVTLTALSVFSEDRLTENDLLVALRYFATLKREGNRYYMPDGSLYAELKPVTRGKDNKNQDGNPTGNESEGARHGLGIFNWGSRLLDQIADALLDALGLDPATYRKWVYAILSVYLGVKTMDAEQSSSAKIVYGTSTAVLALKFFNETQDKNTNHHEPNNPQLPPRDGTTQTLPSGNGTSFIGHAELSKGLRNNNPLNLHVSKNTYKGKITNPTNPDFDSDGVQLERFETFEHGLLAAITHLNRYWRGDIGTLKCYDRTLTGKRDTITKIIYTWTCGQNPHTYIEFVEKGTGIDKDKVLDFKQGTDSPKVLYAMALYECGVKYGKDILSPKNFARYTEGMLKL